MGRVYIIPVEVAEHIFAKVIGDAVLRRAILVLLPAVALGIKALAARPQLVLERLSQSLVITSRCIYTNSRGASKSNEPNPYISIWMRKA
jgi:hypothetical protein